MIGRGLSERLADLLEHGGEPALPVVEGFAALDPREGDGGHFAAVLLVESGHAADSVEGRAGGVGAALENEIEILPVRSGGAGEIAACSFRPF